MFQDRNHQIGIDESKQLVFKSVQRCKELDHEDYNPGRDIFCFQKTGFEIRGSGNKNELIISGSNSQTSSPDFQTSKKSTTDRRQETHVK